MFIPERVKCTALEGCGYVLDFQERVGPPVAQYHCNEIRIERNEIRIEPQDR
jgi:hypothetical protein